MNGFPLTLTLPLREREQQSDIPTFSNDRPANPAARYSQRLAAILPLPGERAGVRVNRRSTKRLLSGPICVSAMAGVACFAADLRSVPQDLHTPPMTSGKPAPGKRFKAVTTGYESTGVYNALYLPTNWKPGTLHPVIVEYPGNGPFTNRLGDFSAGTVEGCNLGYGISGGKNFIWVCLPFVAVKDGAKSNTRTWWGDPADTVAYCKRTVREVCQHYGGDTNALILTGFSRGAIAGNYIGLRDDEIASLWRAFILHSHYDGVRTNWPYADADRASALARLKRLRGRPQFISQENSVVDIQACLDQTGVKAQVTLQALSFPNHCDDWVLRDLPERARLRAWLRDVLKEYPDRAD